jgi:hypothetical protein
MATIGSLMAGITASERYHRFWSIYFPLHLIFYTTNRIPENGLAAA